MKTGARNQGKLRTLYRSVRRKARIWFEWTASGLQLSLWIRNATGPHGEPDARWHNAVLRNRGQVDNAIQQVRKLGLPVIADSPKNWDSLAALDLILRRTGRASRIFDAGGELYSMILQWLYMYGYRNLSAGNIAFAESVRKGPISFHHADITDTGLESCCFDAITCLSVIEHGVDMRAYFREMSRVLKPGGILITSTDYSETPVDTRGQSAYGVPIHIFSRQEVEDAMGIAGEFGLVLLAPLDLASDESVVTWQGRNHLKYTFLVFSMRKMLNGQHAG